MWHEHERQTAPVYRGRRAAAPPRPLMQFGVVLQTLFDASTCNMCTFLLPSPGDIRAAAQQPQLSALQRSSLLAMYQKRMQFASA